jgi:hypothetical protein
MAVWHLDSTMACTHDACMRTTVTLDPDVEQLLRDAAQQRRISFKEALNQAIRAALLQGTHLPNNESPFVVHARRMGLRPGLDSGRLNQIADELEADAFDQLSRTLTETLETPAARLRK